MHACLENMINQLSKREQQQLIWYIQKQFTVTFSEEQRVFRDDIKDKLFEIIEEGYKVTTIELQTENNWIDLNIDADDLNHLASAVEIEFNLEYITPDSISKWNTLSDIISYVEDNIESKEKETQIPMSER